MNACHCCGSSHPRHQRGWSRWCCPLCRRPLSRDVLAEDAHPHCPRLHSDDQLACTSPGCLFAGLGNFVSRLFATLGHNKACRPCRGRGEAGGVACKRCSARGYAAGVAATAVV